VSTSCRFRFRLAADHGFGFSPAALRNSALTTSFLTGFALGRTQFSAAAAQSSSSIAAFNFGHFFLSAPVPRLNAMSSIAT